MTPFAYRLDRSVVVHAEPKINVFLRQEGHLSADDLVDLIRREDHRISRATVYRTLQWMVDAGIARKVDFGEGRFRFEHSYRHPRHFHLICKSCNRSSEFLSSDIEALIEEVATRAQFHARGRASCRSTAPARTCRTGRPATPANGARPSCCSRATRCASPSPPSAAAWSSTPAPRAITRDARGRTVFQKLAEEEKEHLGTLESRYRELLAARSAARVAADVPLLQGRRQRPVLGRRRAADARRQRPAGAD